ncbi:MAG: hypothetical protein QOF89_2945 [Acidobacteriota bacterium]|nr:hypothetical protein [Acidobacteriota bacterium]
MSLKVLVIPEDPANNGYILQPLVERMLTECGRPRAKVTVLRRPRPQGYDHAKKLLRTQLFEEYRFMNFFLFLPDGDGKDRSAEFQSLEREAEGWGIRLVCCAAIHVVETWLLAGHQDRLEGRRWQDVRSDVSVKKNVFAPFLARYGNPKAPGGGRDLLMAKTLSGYRSLLKRCPELAELERRIREALG